MAFGLKEIKVIKTSIKSAFYLKKYEINRTENEVRFEISFFHDF